MNEQTVKTILNKQITSLTKLRQIVKDLQDRIENAPTIKMNKIKYKMLKMEE